MPNDVDLQEVLRRNLRVLTAIRRMTQAELALKLGSDRSTVAKRMNGQREWALQDLAKLAGVFGVTAQELIGDTSALVASAAPTRTGTEGGVSAGVSGRCPRTNPRVVIPFPQAGRMRRGYHSRRDIAIKRGVRPPAAENNGHPYATPVA
jgi:DNA-binding XRE family transcriptional regulator